MNKRAFRASTAVASPSPAYPTVPEFHARRSRILGMVGAAAIGSGVMVGCGPVMGGPAMTDLDAGPDADGGSILDAGTQGGADR